MSVQEFLARDVVGESGGPAEKGKRTDTFVFDVGRVWGYFGALPRAARTSVGGVCYNAPVTAGELESLRRSVPRGSPFGNPNWRERVATELGLQSTLRGRGRPRSKGGEAEL